VPLRIATPSAAVKSQYATPKGRKHAKYEMKTRFAGMPGYVDSTPIREHIQYLVDHQLPMSSIARDAGVRYHCVLNISTGKWDTTRIRQATAIRAVDWHPNPRQQVVSAIGAVRRLRALHALGWSWHVLSLRCPLTAAVITKIAAPAPPRRHINWDTWSAIHDLYEQLSATPAPKGQSSTQARNRARKHGWAPPLDWEGHDIDDPTVIVKPSGVAKGNGFRERADVRREEVARLTAAGLSIEQIAVRLGISKRHVVRYRPDTSVSMDDGRDELSA
jgi:hypothetical protein